MAVDKVLKQIGGRKVTLWVDPTGLEVPLSRVDKNEKEASKIAEKIEKALYKIEKANEELGGLLVGPLEKYAKAHGYDLNKLNMTLYDFSHNFKVKVHTKQIEKPNDNLKKALKKLREFLDEQYQDAPPFLVSLVNEALGSGSRPADARFLRKLKRYEEPKDTDPRWTEAMRLIGTGFDTEISKRYYTFSVKTPTGGWVPVKITHNA